MKPRQHLTKSIFKVGLECPRKLYYHNKPDEYLNGKEEDPFLAALARGGYQVGALANLRYVSGVEIKTPSHEESLQQTNEYFQNTNAVLFEAAFSANSFFVRSDIVIKAGDNLRIIEVKSKSTDSDDEDAFVSPRNSKPGRPKLYASWVPYLYDLAFQVYVARLNFPTLKVSASLMLLDKTTTCLEDGLHQMFRIKRNGKYKEVILTKQPDTDFKGHQILKEIDLTDLINDIIEGKEASEFHIRGTFAERSEKLKDVYL